MKYSRVDSMGTDCMQEAITPESGLQRRSGFYSSESLFVVIVLLALGLGGACAPNQSGAPVAPTPAVVTADDTTGLATERDVEFPDAWTARSMQQALDRLAFRWKRTGEVQTFDPCASADRSISIDSTTLDFTDGTLPVTVRDGVVWKQGADCHLWVVPDSAGQHIGWTGSKSLLRFAPSEQRFTEGRLAYQFGPIHMPRAYCDEEVVEAQPTPEDDGATGAVWRACSASGDGALTGLLFDNEQALEAHNLYMDGMAAGMVRLPKDTLYVYEWTLLSRGLGLALGSNRNGDSYLAGDGLRVGLWWPKRTDGSPWADDTTCKLNRHGFYGPNDLQADLAGLVVERRLPVCRKERWAWRTSGSAHADFTGTQHYTDCEMNGNVLTAPGVHAIFDGCAFDRAFVSARGDVTIRDSVVDSLHIDTRSYREPGDERTVMLSGVTGRNVHVYLASNQSFERSGIIRNGVIASSTIENLFFAQYTPGSVTIDKLVVRGEAQRIKRKIGQLEKSVFNSHAEAAWSVQGLDIKTNLPVFRVDSEEPGSNFDLCDVQYEGNRLVAGARNKRITIDTCK